MNARADAANVTNPLSVPLGTTSFVVTDASRQEDAHGAPEGPRTLLVTATYPTRTDDPTRPRVPCFSRPGEAALNARAKGLPAGVFERLSGAARLGADIDAEGAKLPILLFSHGYETPLSLYTSWMEALARRGYLVLGVTHPYAAGITILPSGARAATAEFTEAAHGPTVAKFSLDQSAVLTALRGAAPDTPLGRLAARSDGARVAALGHSIGGAASVRTARLDPRVVACANLDGSPDDETAAQGLDKPFFLAVSAGFEEVPSYRQLWETARGPGYRLELFGAGHNSFTDLPFCLEGPGVTREDLQLGTIDPARAREATLTFVGAFLDRHVRGLGAALLDGASPYPEARLVRR